MSMGNDDRSPLHKLHRLNNVWNVEAWVNYTHYRIYGYKIIHYLLIFCDYYSPSVSKSALVIIPGLEIAIIIYEKTCTIDPIIVRIARTFL